MQLWGIVGQSKDPSLGKGRCGSNDEFLEAYRALEGKVKCLISENAKLWELANYTTPIAWYAASEQERERMRELGVEVDG
jgi:hypothetical protein